MRSLEYRLLSRNVDLDQRLELVLLRRPLVQLMGLRRDFKTSRSVSLTWVLHAGWRAARQSNAENLSDMKIELAGIQSLLIEKENDVSRKGALDSL